MRNSCVPLLLLLTSCLLAGCAEGPLWRTGSLVPWAREQWEEEERLADTLFERKRELDALVESANQSDQETQEQVALRLNDIVQRDPVLLIRLHAVDLLGTLSGAQAAEALRQAGKAPDSRVRIAAVGAMQRLPAETAVGQIQEILGNDTDVDVRLAATRALGSFPGDDALNALSLALADSNPAVQYRATESLTLVTGENFGANVSAWQSFISNRNDTRVASKPSDFIEPR